MKLLIILMVCTLSMSAQAATPKQASKETVRNVLILAMVAYTRHIEIKIEQIYKDLERAKRLTNHGRGKAADSQLEDIQHQLKTIHYVRGENPFEAKLSK